uniref:NADH-ubiquinone oxidoreductase chain 2 n=2 Tax=unclassified Hiatella TaxID=2619785 RepID=A0AA51UIK5_9BIVA|nr:NADH dehydrogenase subunit 2 [Hiatella sp. J HML-2015]WMW23652.1 NADH dehydrogenase subunit 2 [Hiatella sp. J YW-2023]
MVLSPVRLINYLIIGVSVYAMCACESSLGTLAAFEVNVVASIGVMHWGPKGSRAAGSYLFWQILGSAFFLFSCLIGSSNLANWPDGLAEVLVSGGYFFGFLMKIGCFPFHSWFWDVLVKQNWVNIFVFGVLNKYGQFFVVSNFGLSNFYHPFFLMCFVMTSFVGAVLGLVSEGVRELMVASSLLQTGILGALAFASSYIFNVYFIVYALTSWNFMISQYYFGNGYYFSNYSKLKSSNSEKQIFGWYGICMLGFPPTSGFLMKSFLISSMVGGGNYLLLALMMLSSVLSAGWYYRIMSNFWLLSSGRQKGLDKKLSPPGYTTSRRLYQNFFTFYSMVCVDLILSGSLATLYFLM